MSVAERLHKQLQAGQWLPPQTTIVVAVSGGLDSVVLLDLLGQLQPAWQWQLAVAHLEHDWRTEAETAFVVRLATDYGLPCYVRRLSARPVAAERGHGYEEAARYERYRALADIARQVGAGAVVTGHHQDDQAETVLYRLLRGTSPAGLAAIAPARPLATDSPVRLVRPLLEFSRAELEQEATRRGLTWREDASNADVRFLRNRLRHEVVPLLESIRPGATRQLADLAHWARRDEAYWQDALRALPDGWLRPEPAGGVTVDTTMLLAQPEPLRRRCLEHAVRQAGVSAVTGAHLLQLLSLLEHPQPGAACHLPGGSLAWRENERLCVGPPHAAVTVPAPVDLAPGSAVVWLGGRLTAAIETGPAPGVTHSGQYPPAAAQHGRRQPGAAVAWLDAASLPGTGAMHVRSRQPGDRVRPAGGIGTKKLQDLFTQAKVPRRWRDSWPVVSRADTGDVVWVVGLAVADGYAATTESARCLVLRWERSD